MDVRPFDGRIPYKFENEDGRRMDDPVSVPKPTVAKFAVTATAVPPDDPAHRRPESREEGVAQGPGPQTSGRSDPNGV